jgi:hypothetical protein
MNLSEQIQDYLDGNMPDDMRMNFETQIKNDPALSQELEQYKEAKNIARYLLEQDIKETLDKHRYGDKTSKSFTSRYWRTILIAFIVLIAGILIVRHFQNKTPEKTQPDYDLAYAEPMWPVVRSGDDLQMQEAMHLFLNENNVEAAKAIILKDSLIDVRMRNYWVMEMYLRSKNVDSARLYLPILTPEHPKYKRVNTLRQLFKF